MKSYNAFLKECECSLKLRSLEEDNIEEGFGDFLMGLLGGGASRQLDKMNKAMDKARAQMQIAVDVTRRVEAGSLKLKNPEDERNFVQLATSSGLYNNDGSGKTRDAKALGKHIEIVVAKNKASQIKDSNIKRFMDSFLNKVSSDDYCGLSYS